MPCCWCICICIWTRPGWICIPMYAGYPCCTLFSRPLAPLACLRRSRDSRLLLPGASAQRTTSGSAVLGSVIWPWTASIAACAIACVSNRMNAHAMPERLPPRMMKTSSTVPCCSKICRSSSSELPGGHPPTNSLFSAFVCPRSPVLPPESAKRTCSGLRRGGSERWLCSACIAFCAAIKVVYLTKQQPWCMPVRRSRRMTISLMSPYS
mmetsp:Transcript_55867/g.148293  ORF Transcript_55867/g.148293 Transcript_55867/m.148293 type:complete len:209 (-) Transcript_55867:160-786(-)